MTLKVDTNRLKGGQAKLRRHAVMVLLLTMSVLVDKSFAQKQSAKDLSLAEMVETATKYMNEMKAVNDLALKELQKARVEQKIGKLNQINESLSLIKGLLLLNERRMIALREAAARGDKETAEQNFVQIGVAHEKMVGDLASRIQTAGGLDGDGNSVDGRPQITTSIDSDLPAEEPLEQSNLLELVSIDAARPPSASPFL